MFSLSQDDWCFCEKHDCTRSDRVDLTDRRWTLLWLQQFKGDSFKVRTLRDVLRNHISLPLSQMADQVVCEQVAELFTSRRLHIHQKKVEAPAGGVAPEPEKYVAFPFTGRRPRAPEPLPPPPLDPPTFSPNVEVSSQVAALVAAAAEGIPFCQECQKAAVAAAN